MSLQEQLRKLTTGGPGVTHIASETLFDDCADRLDRLEAALRWTIENWTVPFDEDVPAEIMSTFSSLAPKEPT